MARLNFTFGAHIQRHYTELYIKLLEPDISSPQSNGTIDSDKLVSAQYTQAILSIGARDSPVFVFINSVGDMLCLRKSILVTRAKC